MSDFKGRHFSGQIILWTVRWYWEPGWAFSWQIDETYIRVKGRWMYLYLAITDSGKIMDFYLSTTRNTKAAKHFLSKALRSIKSYNHTATLNTNKNKAYIPAIRVLKKKA